MLLPPSGWRGRLQTALVQRTNRRRSQSTSEGSFAPPHITICPPPPPSPPAPPPTLRTRDWRPPSPGFAGSPPDAAGERLQPPTPGFAGYSPDAAGERLRRRQGGRARRGGGLQNSGRG